MNKPSKPLIIRLVVSLAGAVGVIVLLWVLGPLVGLESTSGCIIGTVVTLALWGLGNALVSWRAARTERSMISALASPDTARDDVAAASAEEVQALGDKLRDALTQLRKAAASEGKGDSLYTLPWYLIIGPPGSGKSTALLNSGLKFPLADRMGRKPVKGVGGTRSCDWWFTNEAVLIDTAGRYTTQDSRQTVYQAGWLGFLGLLKTHRKRQPVNGVLVAVSLHDLATVTAEERHAHALAIKQRLRELHEQLGVRVPVYVLFTKADLIAGFVEFFEDLDREGREQVLGMTFALDDRAQPEGVVGEFSAEFDLLVGRLNDRLADRIHQERDLERRALMFGFPAQFASMKAVAQDFLTEIFQPNRFEVPPLLRGAYFTSGTQEGTPIDRLLGSLAATFGLARRPAPAFSSSARSYFLTRLLREVVFGEASVVGTDKLAERRQQWLRRGAWAGAALVLLGLGSLWVASYFDNERLIAAIARDAAAYRTEVKPFAEPKVTDARIREILPLLNALRRLPGGYDDRAAGRSVVMGLGLSQADKLGGVGEQAYRHALHALFLPRLLVLEANHIRAALDRPDDLWGALKAFLMLSGQGPLDGRFVSAHFQAAWSALAPGAEPEAEAMRRQLTGHLEVLLASRLEPVEAGAPLIEAARRTLAEEQPAMRIWRRIAASQPVLAMPEWRPTDHVDASIGAVFQRASGKRLSDGIPGRFTLGGFRALLPVIEANARSGKEESWVLGLSPGDSAYADFNRSILQLYLDDYAAAWNGLLNDLTIGRTDDWAKAADAVRRLSGSSSLLVKLLDAVRAETVLSPPVPGGAAVPAALADAVAPWLMASLRDFNGKFQAINALTQDSGGGRSPDLAAALAALQAAYQHLIAIAQAEHGVALGLTDPSGEAAGALRRLYTDAGLLPPPVQGWLQSIARQNAASGAVGVRAQLDAAWKADILPWCKQSLNGRYPFAAGADMAMDDFTRLFKPGGLIDAFFTTRMARYVDVAAHPWRWLTVDGTPLGIPVAVLSAFEKARAIRDGFFPDGGGAPSVRFDLRAADFGPGTQEVMVNIDGQQSVFQPVGTQVVQMVWPNPAGARQAWVTFTPVVPPAPAGTTPAVAPIVPPRALVGQTGPWAWFRLVQGHMRRVADRVLVTVAAGSQRVTLEMRPNSVVNPFSLTELRDFQCPTSF
ncbi:MAG: type VI secretion system membrane subunit TssM [Rhodospirillaceae bacterium]